MFSRLKALGITIIILWVLVACASPAPTQPAIQAVAARPTLTPKPTQARATATPSPTAAATLTPTLGPSLTPTPGPTGEALCRNYHAWQVDLRYPGLGAFSYGFNPCESIPLYGPVFAAYLAEQDVDGFPHSSSAEEPNGWRWLRVRIDADGTQSTGVTPGEGCAYFDNNPQVPPPERLCITNVTMRVHNPGDAAHAKKRNHSVVVAARVCDDVDGKPVPPCGTVLTMAIEDWGPKHMPYKTAICYDDTTPRDANGNVYPPTLIDQPPYVALQPARKGFAHQFISTITFNPLVEPFYLSAFPEFPNHIVRTSWNLMDAKEVMTCGGEAVPTGYDASAYLLHALVLANLPTARPFTGYTDKNGYVDPTCTALSETCFLLYVEGSVPQGIPFMSYPVQFDGQDAGGVPTGVIVQEFHP